MCDSHGRAVPFLKHAAEKSRYPVRKSGDFLIGTAFARRLEA
jgi:hypothetical protein